MTTMQLMMTMIANSTTYLTINLYPSLIVLVKLLFFAHSFLTSHAWQGDLQGESEPILNNITISIVFHVTVDLKWRHHDTFDHTFS